MNLYRVLIITGFLLIIFGITVKAVSQVLASPEAAGQTQAVTPSDPVSINIPSAAVKSAVTVGAVDNNVWKLSKDSVLYITVADPSKTKTATLIYGHNFKNLFANLKNAQIGDNIYLTNASGQIFIYKVYSKEDINPKDVGKLTPETDRELILYTCDGVLDQQRVLIKAYPLNSR